MSSFVPPTLPFRRVSECDFKAKCRLIIKLPANEILADTVSEPAHFLRPLGVTLQRPRQLLRRRLFSLGGLNCLPRLPRSLPLPMQ